MLCKNGPTLMSFDSFKLESLKWAVGPLGRCISRQAVYVLLVLIEDHHICVPPRTCVLHYLFNGRSLYKNTISDLRRISRASCAKHISQEQPLSSMHPVWCSDYPPYILFLAAVASTSSQVVLAGPLATCMSSTLTCFPLMICGVC